MLDAITVVAVVDDDVWVTLPNHAFSLEKQPTAGGRKALACHITVDL